MIFHVIASILWLLFRIVAALVCAWILCALIAFFVLAYYMAGEES